MSPADVRAFARDFWEVHYERKDIQAYLRHLEILRLSSQGRRAAEIERILKTSNVGKYLKGQKRSFLVTLGTWRRRLGKPMDGFQWLPTELKARGTPSNNWIQVPKKIRTFRDVLSVLEQLSPTKNALKPFEAFDYNSPNELIREKSNLFGFLLGAMVGDATKSLKGQNRFPSMSIALTLSKAKPNSLRFGNFTELCMQTATGLAMHRIKDAPASARRFTKSECFRWLSRASPLISWIFRVCLGLREGELTTYNPLRMNWLLKTPKSFRAHFLQGVAESDGHVDAGRDHVCLVSSPNTRLLLGVLRSLGCKAVTYKQPPVERIEITTFEAARLPVFNSKIGHLYQDMLVMARARRFPSRVALPKWFVKQIQGTPTIPSNYSRTCLELAGKTGYKVSNQTVKKYYTRESDGKSLPGERVLKD